MDKSTWAALRAARSDDVLVSGKAGADLEFLGTCSSGRAGRGAMDGGPRTAGLRSKGRKKSQHKRFTLLFYCLPLPCSPFRSPFVGNPRRNRKISEKTRSAKMSGWNDPYNQSSYRQGGYQQSGPPPPQTPVHHAQPSGNPAGHASNPAISTVSGAESIMGMYPLASITPVTHGTNGPLFGPYVNARAC